jgi:ankyrin repeat protein
LIIQIEICDNSIEGVLGMRIMRVAIVSFIIFYMVGLVDQMLTAHAVWFDANASFEDVQNTIDAGANINQYDEDGMTGLIDAVFRNDKVLTLQLLNAGAFVNLPATVDPVSHIVTGNTALHYAVRNSDTNEGLVITELLLHKGADVRMRNREGNEPLHEAWRIGGYDTLRTGDAAEINLNKRTQLLRILIKHGADLNARNGSGRTLLLKLIEMYNFWGVLDIFNDWRSLLSTQLLSEMLQVSIMRGLSQQVRERLLNPPPVIGSDGNPQVYAPNGLNGMMHAVIRNDTDMVKRLASAIGSNINAQSIDEFRYTSLVLAIYHRNKDMVELLLELGADPLVRDADGDTALHQAILLPDISIQKKIIDVLLKDEKTRSYLINARNNANRTILHEIVRLNDMELLQYMIDKYGKDLHADIQDNAKRTALDYAIKFKRTAMVNLLRGIGAK